MANVTLQKINKTYPDGTTAASNISFDINDREFVILVGPSGCGKSTILRMIAGLEEITSGKLLLDEELINSVEPKDRDMAMVFQDYALYPHMTVYENMTFGLKLRNIEKKEIEKRAREAAKTLNIVKYLDKKPKALSGGQRQRVALGRAIVRKPKVFLFDEPLSNLDAKLRVQMRAEINKLHNRLNATMIYVTHDQVEAMTMGDKIVVLKEGVIQQIADPLTLYNKPENKFVAGFIGSPSMNFIKGVVTADGNDLYCDEGNFKIKIPEIRKKALQNHVNKKIILGIRPEHIIENEIQDTSENSFNFPVEIMEPLGSEIQIHLKAGDHIIIAKLHHDHNINLKELFKIKIQGDRIHFFDADTEMVIK